MEGTLFQNQFLLQVLPDAYETSPEGQSETTHEYTWTLMARFISVISASTEWKTAGYTILNSSTFLKDLWSAAQAAETSLGMQKASLYFSKKRLHGFIVRWNNSTFARKFLIAALFNFYNVISFCKFSIFAFSLFSLLNNNHRKSFTLFNFIELLVLVGRNICLISIRSTKTRRPFHQVETKARRCFPRNQ